MLTKELIILSAIRAIAIYLVLTGLDLSLLDETLHSIAVAIGLYILAVANFTER